MQDKYRDVEHGHCKECGDYMEGKSFIPEKGSRFCGFNIWVCKDCIMKAGIEAKSKKYSKRINS